MHTEHFHFNLSMEVTAQETVLLSLFYCSVKCSVASITNLNLRIHVKISLVFQNNKHLTFLAYLGQKASITQNKVKQSA